MTGIALAAVMRVIFALVTVQLLKVPGLLFVGGVLLLWVAWKLAAELRHHAPATGERAAERVRHRPPGKTVRQAMLQILVADLSMSLDNVLGVAAVAREHPVILVIGLALSVAFMGFAATLIGRLLERHRWIAWVGGRDHRLGRPRDGLRGGSGDSGPFRRLSRDPIRIPARGGRPAERASIPAPKSR